MYGFGSKWIHVSDKFFEKEVTTMFNSSFSDKWKTVVYFFKNRMRSISYFWEKEVGSFSSISRENVIRKSARKEYTLKIFW